MGALGGYAELVQLVDNAGNAAPMWATVREENCSAAPANARIAASYASKFSPGKEFADAQLIW